MTGIPPDMARLAGLHSSVIRSALQVPLWREHMKADSKSVHTGSEMNQWEANGKKVGFIKEYSRVSE